MLSQILERLKKYWRRRGATSVALAGGVLLSGCAPVGFDPSRPPVTISEVVQLSKAAVPAETIVNRMHVEPTNPEVIYLPEYDPWVVYGAPLITYPGYLGF